MIVGMRARLLSSLVAAGAAVLLLAGCGGGSNDADGTTSTVATTTAATTEPDATTTTATTTTTGNGSPKQQKVVISIENAVPVGGIKRVTVKKGETLTLVVGSDVADEIHLHGYNLKQDVAAGGTAKLTFVANVPGRFEVELEEHGTQIADLTVTP
jgi:ABC-type glycerol-3-phosphate transport system substrate-binding protein